MGVPTNKLVACVVTLFANNPLKVGVRAAWDKDFATGVVVAGIVIAAALSVSGDKDAGLFGAIAPPLAGGVVEGDGVVMATRGGDAQPAAALGDDDILWCAKPPSVWE
jgi:hypothetical protein